MDAFDLIFIAPLWGIISVQLLFEALIEFVNVFIYFAGLIKRKVPAKQNIEEMAISFGSGVLYLILIGAGIWLMQEKLHFAWTTAEQLMYGVFCIFSALYAIPRMSAKWKKSWREATVPKALEQRRSQMEREKEV